IPLLVLAWTDPWHHLYFSSFTPRSIAGNSIALRTFGPGFWAMLAYCYALVGGSILLLAGAMWRSRGLHRAQAGIMLVGATVPLLVDVMDMTRLIPFVPVDLVSPSFFVTGLTFLPALYRLHLLALPPAAWAAVIEELDNPVFVIDSAGRIV